MNTRYPFRILAVLAAILFCQVLVSAQAFSDVSAVMPDGSPTCITCPPTQNFYNATSSAGAKAGSIQHATLLEMPTDGLIHVKAGAFDRFRVFDGRGELWIGGPIPTNHTLDLGYLPAGVYYLHLSSKEGETVHKVIKKG